MPVLLFLVQRNRRCWFFPFYFDKGEDSFYDTLSALQKSIRGSDVNASLHYLGRLLIAGDLENLTRRLSVIAYEDIGLANPSIGPKLDAAINAALRVGIPEARIPLSEIVIEMSLSPKSNSAITAIDQIKQKNYSRIFHDYKGEVLLVVINYDKDTKTHQCQIEKYEFPITKNL